MTIEGDTPIIPEIVADTTVKEVEREYGCPLPGREAATEYLVEHAGKVYEHNEHFRGLIQRDNDGLDYCYAFMRHWLSGYLRRFHPTIFELLPRHFTVGMSFRDP